MLVHQRTSQHSQKTFGALVQRENKITFVRFWGFFFPSWTVFRLCVKDVLNSYRASRLRWMNDWIDAWCQGKSKSNKSGGLDYDDGYYYNIATDREMINHRESYVNQEINWSEAVVGVDCTWTCNIHDHVGRCKSNNSREGDGQWTPISLHLTSRHSSHPRAIPQWLVWPFNATIHRWGQVTERTGDCRCRLVGL